MTHLAAAAHRTAVVEALGVLGSGPEERFDRITRMTQEAFGVPLGFGGPHAGYLAVRAASVRLPATQADSHTFVLPRKDRTPEQRKQAMLFIKQMLEQSMTWAEGGHVPAYMPTFDSTAYKKLTPQSNYAAAAETAVFDDAAWYGGSGSTFEG
ncbi:hypothetical protein IAE22_29525, partial [Bacillus sp. S34]|nr:hypothetical protein [Bacillus sp. S34]